mmetsp:Transcript_9114/g.20279  ORF Transcript_9114/g.20279 Transcript_9114/m.20279 type:complete len:122 (-) Transcript_9114:216-581(-)|eukprot:CAMPEP_0178407162 /NCGR_PEP_ID=MMETSP0689_2-20121128/19285_1 /TAXON_ID=160604 /ORGANISM="Amphidinium massartii, Strain CS-259" /LENGTH=121 /DNA_ID=CAMNT_0020028225 /DNA_START=73 /DNA_END=438 /DNA_ORIENTATION=+
MWRIATLLSLFFLTFTSPALAVDDEDLTDELGDIDEEMDMDMDQDEEVIQDDPKEIMEELDKDGDGFLSKEEFMVAEDSEDEHLQAKFEEHFVKADGNSDSKLDIDELAQLIKNFEEDEEL